MRLSTPFFGGSFGSALGILLIFEATNVEYSWFFVAFTAMVGIGLVASVVKGK